MFFTIGTTGTLQFSFGQNSNGGQLGFYDWAMWPYNGVTTCSQISGNTLPPVRCVWNATTIGGTGLANPIPAGGNAGNYGPPLNVVAGEQYIICLSNWSYATGSVVLDFFGTATIECNMVLPVEFANISAENQMEDVLVNWTTSSELNNDFFRIQHSLDGYHWTDIGEVDGHGNSHKAWSYSFLHKHPEPGLHYYRVVQFDYNGMSKASPMVDISVSPIHFRVYPNPANDLLTLSGFTGLDITIDIYDPSGRLVRHEYSSAENAHQLKTSDLMNGLYTLIISSGETQVNTRVVIDHE
jgi:hypothetical protein